MRPRRTLFGLLGALPLLLGACDESDAVAVKVGLGTDGSGTIVATSLSGPETSGPLADSSAGVRWGATARLVHTSGSFERLGDVRVAEIAFEASDPSASTQFVKVRIPKGPDVSWPRLLAPVGPGERERVSSLLDAGREAPDLGRLLKIEVTLPGPIVANGFTPTSAPVKESLEKDDGVATLLVPVSHGLEKQERDIVWHLTWEKSR